MDDDGKATNTNNILNKFYSFYSNKKIHLCLKSRSLKIYRVIFYLEKG